MLEYRTKQLLGAAVIFLCYMAIPEYAAADNLLIVGGTQAIAVNEGQPGQLTYTFSNPNPFQVIALGLPVGTKFYNVGGDLDDIATLSSLDGCGEPSNDVIAANGGTCTLTVNFTTNEPDSPPDDRDRGFWQLEYINFAGQLSTPILLATAGRQNLASVPITGLVEVDDSGVTPLIPEPPTIVLMSTALGLIGVWRARHRYWTV